MNTTHRKTIVAVLALAGTWPLSAQTPAPASSSAPEDEPVVLSPFEVSATQDRGYQATQTLAGTRIRTNLADVGSAIQVITREFMQDVGATDSGTLLQYTTNAEVAGTRGTYLGQGNATSVDETSNLRNPEAAQRVRGLAAADNTRDFFVTDIPWDSYNVDRIDIQRGPNAILFGLGSPAGIVNAATHNAEFRNLGSVEARTGSYGTFRSSIDVNQQLIDKVLAIRVDGMWDNHKYEQKQAWQNDRRFYGALRFEPKLFNRDDFHTSIKVKFENGDIKADRPRSLPPYDSITPWFAPVDQTSQDGGLGKLAVPNGYVLGSNAAAYFPWLGGYANQQQPIWFVDGTSNQLYRIYGGYVNTGALNTAGVPQGAGINLVGQKYADTFSDLTNFHTYALNAKLPNYQYGQYRDRVLTDPTVFDFYHNLIDGPTASQFEKWNAFNVDLTQTFWDDRVGLELSYDRQRYKRGGQALLGFTPTLNIDILQNFQDYVIGANNTSNTNVANPNFGRPFVPAGPGRGSSYESDRKYFRGSLFGEVRASDFFAKGSFLEKLLGKHRFNGVYSDEQYYTENLEWQMYANSLAYATFKTQGNPDGFQNLAPVAVVYLGATLKDASSAVGAGIPGISSSVTLQDGNIYQFDSTWKNPTGVGFSDPWNIPANLLPFFNLSPNVNPNTGAVYPDATQVSNPANYVGWNSNFHDTLLRYDNGADKSLLTTAARSLRQTKSWAGSWQGFLWNDAIVPTLGWRYDEVSSKSATAKPVVANRGALDISPDVYKLPDAFPANQIYKNHSTAGGVVVHLNKLLDQHDFLPINISLSYNKSNNFQVTDIRHDIYGNPIPNPTGSTKEYGLLLSTKDDKYSLRIVKYDTTSTGVNTQLSIGDSRSGLIGTISDAMNWKNIKTYYMSLYSFSTANQTDTRHYSGVRYMWDAVYVDNTTGRPTGPGAPGSAVPANSHLETQAEADARRDASITALNDFEKFLAGNGYFAAWNYGVGPASLSTLTTPGAYQADPSAHQPADPNSIYDYRGNPSLQNFFVTSDARSKGYEYELTANPLPNWRIAFNAAQTTAVRTNVGGPALDGLVSYMDTLMAGPGGDLVRFNSDYSAANELRTDWSNWRGQYTLLKLQEGTATSELRKWRYNVVTNYSFDHGFFKGAGVGAGYRWQDKVVIGYPVIPDPVNPTLGSFDLTKPYYGPSEDALDFWISYERKLTKKIDWRIQLNVYNVGKSEKLIPISVEPDGHTWAAARIAPVEEWQLTNTFSF
ncbi:MAG TPA: TonB-dependent receptor plug domain-containing protein [Opitutus sp.]|nr:TonB-dependent receptor plug domain-containing protein [Opitutus sp.]